MPDHDGLLLGRVHEHQVDRVGERVQHVVAGSSPAAHHEQHDGLGPGERGRVARVGLADRHPCVLRVGDARSAADTAQRRSGDPRDQAGRHEDRRATPHEDDPDPPRDRPTPKAVAEASVPLSLS